MNSRIDDAAERRPPARRKVRPRLSARAGAEFHQSLQTRQVNALEMQQRPAKAFDRIVPSNRAKSGEMKIIFCGSDGMLLQEPAVLRNHAGGRLELRRHSVHT